MALGPFQALLMLAVVLGVQQVESHILQPLVLGRAVSVHPLAVVLAIGAGLIVAGIAGALFAVPLAAVVNTVVLSLRDRHDPAAAEPRRLELRRPQLRRPGVGRSATAVDVRRRDDPAPPKS